MGRRLAVSSRDWEGRCEGAGDGGGRVEAKTATMGDGGAGKNDEESEKSFVDGFF